MISKRASNSSLTGIRTDTVKVVNVRGVVGQVIRDHRDYCSVLWGRSEYCQLKKKDELSVITDEEFRKRFR